MCNNCEHTMSIEKQELLGKLTILDFICYDLGLYLDTHPTDCEGLTLFNKMAKAGAAVRRTYEKEFGSLRYNEYPNPNEEEWLWIKDPWPWEKHFRVEL